MPFSFTFLSDEFESFLHGLRPFIPNESEIVHPKLLELRNLILQHVEESKNAGCKVWVRLLRHSDVIAPRIYALLTEAGIDCVVDPRIWRCGNSQVFDGSQNVIIAEKIASDFPRNLLTLIINYERPSVAFPHLSTIPQLTLAVERPACVEDSRKSSEVGEISSCGFNSAPSPIPSSPPSHGSSTNTQKLHKGEIQTEQVMDSSAPAIVDLPPPADNSANAQVSLGIAEMQSPVTKATIDEISIAMGDCFKTTEVLSTDHQSSANVTSETIETADDEMDYPLPFICASHVKKNTELMNAIELIQGIQVYECDYS